MVKRGIPSVLLVSDVFVKLARGTAAALGYQKLPMLVVPHPFGVRLRSDVEQLAREKAREFAEDFVRPQADTT